MSSPFPFDNTYARLPDRFFARVAPTRVSSPRLIRLNRPLASQLGLDLDQLTDDELAEIFAGNRLPATAETIAMAYAGHQFGGFVPQLGDGRAILLGEVIDREGRRRDVQLKGPGRTPFSRRGDGRAVLGPVLREYVVSEAMAALGIPTTRALAAVTTGEGVMRDELLPGAVFTRVASSHIRVGTFQFFASRGDVEGVRTLADYAMTRHYPEAARAEKPYHAFLREVIAAQADLIAQWLLIGFIHGVMNTDNMAISGETIDYGPCAFVDEYDPSAVFSAIDQGGRYAYANQPAIGQWNLTRLAECLLPLLSEDQDVAVKEATEELEKFPSAFEQVYQAGLRRKLGLLTAQEEDLALGRDLLQLMAEHEADYTLTFRQLSDAAMDVDAEVRTLLSDQADFSAWMKRWRQRLAQETTEASARRELMRAVNPAFIPRNHRIEAVIRAAVDHDNFQPFEELIEVLARPFEDQPAFAHYTKPPQEHERVRQTFCGT